MVNSAEQPELRSDRFGSSDREFLPIYKVPGGLLKNETALRQFQRFVKDTEMPAMCLHDLRHSCATLLLSKAVHPRVVKEILGHWAIAMTMNVYNHVVPEIASAAADTMDDTFNRSVAS